jgi:hypothetical protein
VTVRTAFKLILLAGLVAVPSAALGDDPKADKADAERPVTVPFELLKTRHMAIQVKLNGKGPYRLIFDTGAPFNVINNRIAKDSGVLDPKAKKSGMMMFGMAGQQVVKEFETGGAKLEKVPVMVMDHPTVGMISQVLGPVDGIVGFPFFARYRMTIDYQKKELTLVPNGYKPADFLESMMTKMLAGPPKEPAVIAPAGVWGLEVDKEADDEDAGVRVKEVLKGGAADAAGLKAGDRLLTIDGRWTDTVTDTFAAASVVKPGREVEVVVKRGGKELRLKATPGRGV